MKILNWNIIKEEKKIELKQYFKQNNICWKKVWIFLLKNHKPSQTYVNLKRNFWEDVWIQVDIFDYNSLWLKENKEDYNIILDKIKSLNENHDYIGLVIQLPFPDYLEKYKNKLLTSILPSKDIDWLWWVLFWLSSCDLLNFTPATPASVLHILEYYWFSDVKWKNITIIWQSNLVWKPLALEFIKKGAEVYTFNEFWQKEILKKICKISDIIISATWKVHLINKDYINNNNSQTLIDVWWWIKDWKICWDIDFESVKNYVKAITPVPWWVWPSTVANLFNNIKVINEQKNIIPYYLDK